MNVKTLMPIIITLILIVGGIVFFFSRNNDNNEPIETPNESAIENVGLLLNFDKDNYSLKEKVYFQIATIDENNKSDCDAKLELNISGPENYSLKLSTDDDTITPTTDCGTEIATNNPDYSAFFEPEIEGKYTIKLVNLDNDESIESSLSVGDVNSDISLTRWGASKVRASDSKRYPMKFTVKAMNDFSGQLVEHVPNNLEIAWQGPAKIDKSETIQTMTWDIDLKAGEEKEFTYEYIAGETENSMITLGKAKIVSSGEIVFQENRPWQIITN